MSNQAHTKLLKKMQNIRVMYIIYIDSNNYLRNEYTTNFYNLSFYFIDFKDNLKISHFFRKSQNTKFKG